MTAPQPVTGRSDISVPICVMGLFWAMRLWLERQALDHGMSKRRFTILSLVDQIHARVAAR